MSDSFMFTCKTCNVPCGTPRAYQNHLRSNQHRDNIGLSPHTFPCPGCHKLLSRGSEVKRHLKNGRCSGSRLRLIARTTQSLKHRLSAGSTDVLWKHRRTRSPAQNPGDDLPDALVLDHDLAEIHADIDFDENGVPITSKPRYIKDCVETHIFPYGFTDAATFDTGVNTTKTQDEQDLHEPVDLLPFQAHPRKATPPAAIAEEAADITLLGSVAEAIDHDIEESIKALSVTEEITTCARSGTESRINSFRMYSRSSRLRDSHPFSTYTNSIGSLFGRSGASIRVAEFMRSPARSFISGYRSSAFSNEMPAPMGERVDDELRWARESQGEYRNLDREINGRRLVRDAAEGDYQSVYDSLIFSNVDINYLPTSGNRRTAVGEAGFNGHVKVLDAIVRAFTLSAPHRHSHLCMSFLSGHHDYRVIPNLTTKSRQEWDDFNSSLRVMIANVSCLCPEEVRPGTICERVASGQIFHLDAIKSGCLWGEKLLQTTWPNMSKLVWLPTVDMQREFLRSLELDGVFYKSEKVLPVCSPVPQEPRKASGKPEIEEDTRESHAPQNPDPTSSLLEHESFELETQTERRLRELGLQ
jgi:hypothetical protein